MRDDLRGLVDALSSRVKEALHQLLLLPRADQWRLVRNARVRFLRRRRGPSNGSRLLHQR